VSKKFLVRIRPPRIRTSELAESVALLTFGKAGSQRLFEEAIEEALNSLPTGLRAALSNVAIVVEDEPPDGRRLLGLYQGVPLPRRSRTYSGALPDKISIFRGPITRLAAGDADRLRREVRHVVLHEIAHHFGISDARLIELGRY
jgi:predicted Zn-dependent protease with MMP-like domain